jgi:hypothetical protein
VPRGSFFISSLTLYSCNPVNKTGLGLPAASNDFENKLAEAVASAVCLTKVLREIVMTDSLDIQFKEK